MSRMKRRISIDVLCESIRNHGRATLVIRLLRWPAIPEWCGEHSTFSTKAGRFNSLWVRWFDYLAHEQSTLITQQHQGSSIRVQQSSMVMAEPAHLIGVQKHCLHCHATDNHFRYYNNGDPKQPRYLCHQCNHHFTLGGKVRTKKSGPQSKTIKKEDSIKIKSGKNLTRQKMGEKVSTGSTSCEPAAAAAAQSEAADASALSQAKNCSLRQAIYVRNVCPTCSTSYTARMNAPDTDRYFGRILYKSWYSCVDCHHTFDVDLEWPTDDASSSSNSAGAAPALLVEIDGKKVTPGAHDEPANFLAPPECGECSSKHTRFLDSIKIWKKCTRHSCVKCSL